MRRRDTRDGQWFDGVLHRPNIVKEFLIFLAGTPVIDLPFQYKDIKMTERTSIPCYCPFHKQCANINSFYEETSLLNIFM